MKKITLVGLVIALNVFACKLYAADDCSKKTSDPEVLTCAENNRTHAEKALNDEYAEAKKRINDLFSEEAEVRKKYLATFLESQRSWLKYRNTQCKLFAQVADKGSNPYTVFTNSCIASLDEERVKQLKEIPY